MPYKYCRKCPLCQRDVKDISSHLRLKHSLSSVQRAEYLHTAEILNKPVSIDCPPLGDPTRLTEPPVADTYLSQNLALLRLFFAMTRERKKWYLKHDAPITFVRFMRESLNMIEVGRINCGKKLDKFYKDKILSRHTSDDRTRALLSKENVINFVECMTVEVLGFLSEILITSNLHRPCSMEQAPVRRFRRGPPQQQHGCAPRWK